MSGTSMNAAGSAIYAKLAATSALTSLLAAGTASVFETLAPENTDPPYVVFQEQAPSTPQRTLARGIGYENALYTVKVITQSLSMKTAGEIADQIDAALDNATLTMTGYTVMSIHRIQNVSYPEFVEGKRFNHRGAVYRLMCDPT
jgi:hypothetical protein